METYLPIILVNSILLIVAFTINKKNAKYLLAGYNTMTVEEQKRFDIDNYLIFLKKSFIGLTLTSSILFIALINFFSLKTSLISYSTFIFIIIFWMALKSQNSYFKS
jgi:hypothetical protein